MKTTRRVDRRCSEPSGACAAEQQEQGRADERRRKAQARVGEHPQVLPAPEAAESEDEPDGDPDHRRDQGRDERDLEREADDLQEIGIPFQMSGTATRNSV